MIVKIKVHLKKYIFAKTFSYKSIPFSIFDPYNNKNKLISYLKNKNNQNFHKNFSVFNKNMFLLYKITVQQNSVIKIRQKWILLKFKPEFL